MAEGAVILEGFFLKKKRDDKKSLLSSKYQKRFFQLTSEHLAYAKEPQEIRNRSMDVHVFPLAQLAFAKVSKEVYLEIRFPSRVLKVKAETAEQAYQWEAALQKANMMAVTGECPGTPGKKKPNEFAVPRQKSNHVATIEAESDDDDSNCSPAATPKKPPPPLNTALPKFNTAVSIGQERRDENKPPSPRSMLANPSLYRQIVSQAKPQPEEPETVRGHYNYQSSSSNDDRWHQQQQQQQQPSAGSRRVSRPDDECLTLQPAPVHSPLRGPSARPSAQQQQQHLASAAERLVLDDAPLPRSGPNSPAAHLSAQSRSRSNRRTTDDDGEVLTLGRHEGSAGGSHLGRPPVAPRNAPLPQYDDEPRGVQPSRGSGRGQPSPSYAHSLASQPSPRGQSAASSKATGSNDENWLDDDWDSDDEPRNQQQQQQGTGTPKRPGAADGVRTAADDDDWDSDDGEPARHPATSPPPRPQQQQQQQQQQQSLRSPGQAGRSFDEPHPPSSPSSALRVGPPQGARPPQSPVPASPNQRGRLRGRASQELTSGLSNQLSGSMPSRFSPNSTAAAAPPPQARGALFQEPPPEPPSRPAQRAAQVPNDAGVQMDNNFVDDDWDDE